MINLSLLIIMICFFSCGKPPEDKTDEETEPEVHNEGTYSAVLLPVNPKISTTVSGDVKVSRYGDDFRVSVKMQNVPKGNLTQAINYGSICPKISQDLNGDGYIDAYESRGTAGFVVVPLDGDLGAQDSGNSYVLEGNYTYSKTTSYYLMLTDLHLPDDIVNDGMMKIPDNNLPLERRVVTVSLRENSAPAMVTGDVPIACGILTKISDEEIPPGDSTDDGNRRRPRKPPRRPHPNPTPDPEPEPDPPPRNDTWWERMRERWNRWRDRWGGGGGSISSVSGVSESQIPFLSQTSFQTRSRPDEA